MRFSLRPFSLLLGLGLLLPSQLLAQAPPPSPSTAPATLGTFLHSVRRLATTYHQAHKHGKIARWEAFHWAQGELRQAQTLWKNLQPSLQTSQPPLSSLVSERLALLQKAVQERASPHTIGKLTYGLLAEIQTLRPHRKTQEIASIQATGRMLTQRVIAEQVSGPYRIGLFLRQPRTLYQLQEVGRYDQRIVPLPPGSQSDLMLGVILRDHQSGDILSGTDVSLEILHPQTKQQISSRKMTLVWESYPFYALSFGLPAAQTELLFQITVSPFPVTRTAASLNQLRLGGIAQFKAKIVNGGLDFPPKADPSTPQAAQGGLAFLRAMEAVGGQSFEEGSWRAGVALIHPEETYRWNSGSLSKETYHYRTNGQWVVFLQDLRTGLLVPQMRVTAFLYWREAYGMYRASFQLQPVYNGFPAYSLPASIPRRTFEKVSIQFDAPVIATFRARPQNNFLIESDLFHANLLPRPALRRRTKTAPPPRR